MTSARCTLGLRKNFVYACVWHLYMNESHEAWQRESLYKGLRARSSDTLLFQHVCAYISTDLWICFALVRSLARDALLRVISHECIRNLVYAGVCDQRTAPHIHTTLLHNMQATTRELCDSHNVLSYCQYP